MSGSDVIRNMLCVMIVVVYLFRGFREYKDNNIKILCLLYFYGNIFFVFSEGMLVWV